MNKNVEILELSAKLPGYLFILANATDIGETVSLYCQPTQQGFYRSMLELIGLNVELGASISSGTAWSKYIFIICDDTGDLEHIKKVDAEDALLFILLPERISRERLDRLVEQYLHKHYKWIVITEIYNCVHKKTFYTAFSTQSNTLKKLKSKIVKYQLCN